MNLMHADRYTLGSMLLAALALLYLAIISLSDRHDLISATMIIAATTLFLTAILLFAFSRRQSLDDTFVPLLPVQSGLNLCRVAADLGLAGQACLLPPETCGCPDVMQLIPVTGYSGDILSGDSFVSGPGGAGMLIFPAGKALLDHLKKERYMSIPGDQDSLTRLFQEIGEDVLDVADTVRVSWQEDAVVIRMDGYRLISGCRAMAAASPACCTMNPCPVCSLFSTCIVEGLGCGVRIERCTPGQKKEAVEVQMTLLPGTTPDRLPDRQP